MSRYPFSSYPNGWFKVAFSDEIVAEKVKSMHYFGRDLVAFRGENGQPYVLDAHCPHLGAHLGKGGQIIGNTLRCPFHGWTFAGDGKCVQIPYCEKIPPKAKIRAWHVKEINGIVFVYYDALNRDPAFDLPVVPEYGASTWSSYFKLQWRVRGHIEEIAENAVDYPHFNELHVYTSPPVVESLDISNHNFRVVMTSTRKLYGKLVTTDTDIMYHGLGLVVSPVSAGKNVNLVAVLTPTAIDDEHIQINLSILFKKSHNPLKDFLMFKLMMPEIRTEFERDIPIWENKVYHTRPVLCAEDGPIMRLRRWAKQFYVAQDHDHQAPSPTEENNGHALHRRHTNSVSSSVL